MYKYFSELEKPKDFKIYLNRGITDKNRDYYLSNIYLENDDYKEYEDLFKKIKILDILIEGSNYELLTKYFSIPNSFDVYNYDEILDFFIMKEENYTEIKFYYKEKIKLNFSELRYILLEYEKYSRFLTYIYPEFKNIISNIENEIKIARFKLHNKHKIEIPPLSDGVEHKMPNAWYITPNGYLYNTTNNKENVGYRTEGHRYANLIYPFNEIKKTILKTNNSIQNINNDNQIKEILKRGYITGEEFIYYSNLTYKLPTILTPEVEQDIEQRKNLLKKALKESEKESYIYLSNTERSYQKNIINLIIGHLSAETSLYQSFVRLNDSKKRKEIFDKLYELTKGYLPDILVRYSGFHKIESVIERTITTSSLRGIEIFKRYLDKGWNLVIIPGIVYDKQSDELSEVNFDSYIISNYLDETLNNYKGKGKILIKQTSNTKYYDNISN